MQTVLVVESLQVVFYAFFVIMVRERPPIAVFSKKKYSVTSSTAVETIKAAQD